MDGLLVHAEWFDFRPSNHMHVFIETPIYLTVTRMVISIEFRPLGFRMEFVTDRDLTDSQRPSTSQS